MEFKGRIAKVMPQISGPKQDGGQWTKVEFIFEYFEHPEDRWADRVVLSAMNDRISEYDLHEGDEVNIGFGHMVREYQGRYFNEVRIYRFEKVTATATTSSAPDLEQESEQKKEEKAEEDGLPF